MGIVSTHRLTWEVYKQSLLFLMTSDLVESPYGSPRSSPHLEKLWWNPLSRTLDRQQLQMQVASNGCDLDDWCKRLVEVNTKQLVASKSNYACFWTSFLTRKTYLHGRTCISFVRLTSFQVLLRKRQSCSRSIPGFQKLVLSVDDASLNERGTTRADKATFPVAFHHSPAVSYTHLTLPTILLV